MATKARQKRKQRRLTGLLIAVAGCCIPVIGLTVALSANERLVLSLVGSALAFAGITYFRSQVHQKVFAKR